MESKQVRIYADVRHPHMDMRIIDENGNVPSSVYRPEDETWEGTLGRIGREVIGRFLSVDKRLVANEKTSHDIVYLTDEVDHSQIDLAEGWQWGSLAEHETTPNAA